MTRIVLLNPPLGLKARYGSLADVGNLLPHLGLIALAACLREKGHFVKVIDAPAEGLDHHAVALKIAGIAPDIVGITSVTAAIDAAFIIAAECKKLSPKTTIVLGGAHASSSAEEVLKSCPQIDFAVVGEGELTFIELTAELENGRSGQNVAGTAYRKDTSIVIGPPRKYIEDLDSLPFPAWDLLPDLAKRYRPSPQSIKRLPSTILVTSRGCPFVCTFCDRSVFGRKIRSESAERVFSAILHLSEKYGIRDIAFHDESLIFDEARLLKLCDLLMRSNIDITFSCQGRVDQTLSDQAFKALKSAGCWQIQFGIETGSDEGLRRLGKGFSLEHVRSAVTRAASFGIQTKAFFMLGIPGETLQSLEQTRKFVLSVPLNDAMIGFFAPLPGTAILPLASESGQSIGKRERLTGHQVSYLPHGLTENDLINSRKHFYRSFYFRPGIIYAYIRRMAEPTAGRPLLKGLKTFLQAFVIRNRIQ